MFKINAKQCTSKQSVRPFQSGQNFANSQSFNQTIQRLGSGVTASNVSSTPRNSVIQNTHTHYCSTSSPQVISQTVSMNVQINKFALQAISQIIGLISQLIAKLELGTNGPGKLAYDIQLPDYSPTTPDADTGSDKETPTQDSDTPVADTPETDTPVVDKPETPTAPVAPQEIPKAGDLQIRLGPVDDASQAGELSGQDRPNPRDISNTVAAQNGQTTSNSNNASDMLWSWGQFIDHDMVLTKEGEETANIRVPAGDRNFDPLGTGGAFIPFTRSDSEIDAYGNRTQINEQTALIDASMVYDATAEETATLRSFEDGKMKIDDYGYLLPYDRGVLAGDQRAAEQPGLLSLHTLFVREHNRQAAIIADAYPTWTDDQIFNEARRIVGNQIQAITYNEFLPTLLGCEAPIPAALDYDPTVNGQVSSEFATAAFRIGHTMVNSTVASKNADGSISQASLGEVFFRPDYTKEIGMGSILAGQSEQKAQAIDPMIVDELRNQLLGSPDQAGPRLDLASLNVQRGRDHNIPTYNEMRQALGMHAITDFNDPVFQDGVGAKLAEVYDTPDDIDLWVGGLSEVATSNSMLGETFTNIIAEQFYRTAAADPDFYTNTASAEERAYLDKLTLSDIIRANSDTAVIDDTAFTVG